LGDSTINPRRSDDPQAVSTAFLLAQLVPDYDVAEFAHWGYSLIDFDAYVRFFFERGSHSSYLIVPINLRSFSPTWDRSPGLQFERERLFARRDSYWFRAFFRPMATFGVFTLNQQSQEAYRATPYFDGTTPIGTLGDLPHLSYVPDDPAIIAMTTRALYAGAISPQHRLFDALRNIIRTCHASRTNLVLYITPVDYTTGDVHLHGTFSNRLRDRVNVVVQVVSEEGATALDLTRAFGPEMFYKGNHYVEDHLVEEGRRRLAETLARTIRAHDAAQECADAL
jgi:hypothetical protein